MVKQLVCVVAGTVQSSGQKTQNITVLDWWQPARSFTFVFVFVSCRSLPPRRQCGLREVLYFQGSRDKFLTYLKQMFISSLLTYALLGIQTECWQCGAPGIFSWCFYTLLLAAAPRTPRNQHPQQYHHGHHQPASYIPICSSLCAPPKLFVLLRLFLRCPTLCNSQVPYCRPWKLRLRRDTTALPPPLLFIYFVSRIVPLCYLCW